MTTILFVDNKIPQYDILLNSLIVNYYDFNNKDQILFNEINRIGFIWENNYNIFPFGTTNYKLSNGKFSSFFSDEFIQILKLLNAGTIIDLITCELKSQNFKDELDLILQEINITINYSVNLTGNPPYGDWIMESSNENISSIYFNSNIDNFTSILLVAGNILPNDGNIYFDIDNSYTYQLNTTSSWSDISTYGSPTTIFASGIDNSISSAINIGFNFKLGTQTYSQFQISTNGSLFFGAQGNASNSLVPSTIGNYPCFAFIYKDLLTKLNGIRYILTSDFLLIQNELRPFGNSVPTYNVQIFLYKTGKIEIKYQTTNSSYSFYVALCYSSTNYFSLNTSGQIIYNQNILVNDAYLNNKTLTIDNNSSRDLSGFNLSNYNLSNSDLSGYNLTNANLTNANLTSANLTNTNLTNANLTSANLSSANLTNTNLTNTKTGPLSNFTLTLPNNNYKNITTNSGKYIIGPSVNLSDIDLNNLDLSGYNLTSVNLTNTKTGPLINFPLILPNSNYKNITIFNNLKYIIGPSVNLSNIDLTNVDLSNIDLSNTNLTSVFLTNTKTGPLINFPLTLPSIYYKNITITNGLKYIIGPSVNLSNVDLSGTNLLNTYLTGVNLTNTKTGPLINFPLNLPNSYQNIITFNNLKYIIGPSINLSSVDLTSIDLTSANLTNANLTNANLTNADLYNVNLTSANLTNANLTNTKTGPLSNFTLTLPNNNYKNITTNSGKYIIGPSVNLSNIDLNNLDLSGYNLTSVNLTNTKTGPLINFPLILPNNNYQNITIFNGLKYIIGPSVNLSNIDLTNVDLSNIDLSNTNLTSVFLTNTKTGPLINFPLTLPSIYYKNITITNGLKYIIGPSVNLSNVDLSGTNLLNTYLTGVNLTNTKTGPLINFPLNLPNSYQNITTFNNLKYIIGPSINLSSVNLTSTNLTNSNLSSANLISCDLSGATLSSANLSSANLTNANLTNTITGPLNNFPSTLPNSNYKNITTNSNKYIIGPSVNLSSVNLTNTDLSNSNLSGCNLTSSTLTSANLSNVNLTNVNLTNSTLTSANLTNANLTNTKTGPLSNFPLTLPNNNYKNITTFNNFKYIIGPSVNLSNINLTSTNLTECDLSSCNLSGSNLTSATLTNTKTGPLINFPSTLPSTSYKSITTFNNLKYIIGPNLNLQFIDLSGTNISNINLSNSNLQSSILSNTNLSGCNLSATDLSGAILFNTKSWPIQGRLLNLPNNIDFKQVNNKILGPNLNLQYIDLSGIDISNTNLSNSNLFYSNLTNVNLSNSNLSNSNIKYTNFTLANLDNTDISNINLIGTNIANINGIPININSNWKYDLITKSIIPITVSLNTFANIILDQLNSLNSNNKIIIYKDNNKFFNQEINVIKPIINSEINFSNSSNNIQLVINNISNADISNILINVTTQSETNIAIPKINNTDLLFILYFKILDLSGNSIVSPTKPFIINISLNANSNFIKLFKYVNSRFDLDNYILGSKLTSNLSINTYEFYFTSNSEYGAIPFEIDHPTPTSTPTPTPTPTPLLSNICFVGNTPITTNQGNIPIDKINSLIHTIHNKKILRIIQTTTQDKYLVCFEKDSLAPNIPSQKTIISNFHCIYYQGKMMQARDFVGKYENVKNIRYRGEILYNVLMEDHEKMLVNNLICETLNPKNKIVEVYKFIDKLNPKEQESFIKANNKYVIDNKVFNK